MTYLADIILGDEFISNGMGTQSMLQNLLPRYIVYNILTMKRGKYTIIHTECIYASKHKIDKFQYLLYSIIYLIHTVKNACYMKLILILLHVCHF